MFKQAVTTLGLTAVLALPAQAAFATDQVIAPDPAAQQITTLDGTLVWVTGAFGAQKLMQRTESGGITAVRGAPVAQSYRSVDLGVDGAGKLVLTYERCSTLTRCKTLRDDLAGRRRSISLKAIPRCVSSTAPAVWRTRMVAGYECRTASGNADAKRSGLYVQTGAGTPKRLPLPKHAVEFGATSIEQVDLRGTRAAATAVDVYEYAFSVDTDGEDLRGFLGAASEGETDGSVRGLALGTTSTLWAVSNHESSGFPREAVLHRQRGSERATERMRNATEAEQHYQATDVAADGTTLHLLVPGTGIVAHTFAPAGA